LKIDRDEVNNLATDPAHAKPLARLEKLLADARKQFGDPVDFDRVGSGTSAVAPGGQQKK
jgi:hypothetical protein